MKIDSHSLCLIVVIVLVTLAGCKPRSDASRQSGQASEPGAAEVAAVRDALTRGMQQTTFDSLAAADVGRQCVVTARAGAAGTGTDQAPPPFGMVHRLGQTVIYKGEIEEVLPDGLKIRAAYPTSGRYKTIEIPRSDIQSLHVAKPSPGYRGEHPDRSGKLARRRLGERATVKPSSPCWSMARCFFYRLRTNLLYHLYANDV